LKLLIPQTLIALIWMHFANLSYNNDLFVNMSKIKESFKLKGSKKVTE